MPSQPRLLRAGDLVRFDGRLHTVAALEGTAVRLVDETQSASVVMLAHLLSSSGFEVVTPASVRTVVPAAGVLEGFPAKAVERAKWWQRHLVEMLTGRPLDAPQGPARAEYDPAVRSLRQRELAKAAELAAAGHSTSLALIQRMRRRFENEGVLGLVDPRLRAAPDGTGRADRRVVEALRKVVDEQTGRSTVSAQVLRRRMERLLEAEHGPGVVPPPSRTVFYRLLKAVSSGRHTLGSARTRRSLASLDATGKLWSGLAHRHYRLNRRVELLHDLVRVKGPTVEPDKTAPWRIAAGYPEHITLISLFASVHWRQSILSEDLLAATHALAEFHRRFPLQTPLRGTSRTWLSTTIEATARQIEGLLNPSRGANRVHGPVRHRCPPTVGVLD
ncbi:hypothetical protein ACIA8E_31180 [Streptomyces sp. NPDC051664]|uniref:hypothetical protein n=1 Tax=Streptomyces sp. NPDC051664 TaxID=3365668 RepID=UPI00378B6178